MALVEIDEGQWNSAKQVVGVMEKLLSNPKTRRKVLEAQKELNPNLAIPEIDAAHPVQEQMAALEKLVREQNEALAADKAERAEEKRRAEMEGRWSKGRSKLRKQGWSDEGIERVEKFMEEKLVADHEVAAAAYEKMNPDPEPISPAGNRFDLFAQKTGATDKASEFLLQGNDDAFLASVIPSTLAEMRGR
jgi:hypothetical protein